VTSPRVLSGGLAGIAAALALSVAVLKAANSGVAGPAQSDPELYLRSSTIATRVLPSFHALAADVYWIRAIQYDGKERKSVRESGRFQLLFPLLDLATSLDPHFHIAYRFGAVFLAEPPPAGPGRTDQAVELLEKGLRSNPRRWHYAFDIGFVYFWAGVESGRSGDFVRAAEWFERGSMMPGSPVWLRQLAATTRAGAGDVPGAERLLRELSHSDDPWIRDFARRGLDQLAALERIGRLQTLVHAFAAEHHHWPAGWAEIGRGAKSGPLDPAGIPYEYDAASHHVALSSRSPLYPLPRMPGAR
jgi:hypothetical protein